MYSAFLTWGKPRSDSSRFRACGKSCNTAIHRALPITTCCLICSFYYDDARGQATPCTTVGTGQVLATNTCSVTTTPINTTTANPAAITSSGALASVTATGVTTNLAVVNGIGFRAMGGQIFADNAQIRTTSTGTAANGQTGVLASGLNSSFTASGLTVSMVPAAGVSLTAVRAEAGGQIMLTGGQIDIGSAGSGRNFNHGLLATGDGSAITATGMRVTANSNFSDAVRAESGGTVTLSGGTFAANGAGNVASGPSAVAAAVSGGKLFINGPATTLTGGVMNQAYGLWVSGAGSQATVTGTTIAATGGSKSAGIVVEDGATATIENSNVTSATYFGVWASGGAQVTLTNSNVSSQGTNALNASGAGTSVTVNGGSLAGFYQVPTVGAANATVTINNAAIRSSGNANAPGVYASVGSLVTLNGGTVDAFGTTDRGQRVKGIAAATAGAVLVANDVAIHTYGDEALGVAADDGGTVTVNRGTVLTDKRNAIGIYAGVDPTKPGEATVFVNSTHVETFGEIAHGAQAQAQTSLAIPATVTLDQNATVTTHGVGAVGLRAVLKGRINAIQSVVSTEGVGAHGMLALGDQSLVTATDSLVQTTGAAAHGGVARDGGRITGSAATVTATGTDSAGLYVVGEIAPSTAEFSTSALSSTSGPGIAIAGAGSVNIRGGTVFSHGDWLRVGAVTDFPALGTPEPPIPLPEEPQNDVDFTSAPAPSSPVSSSVSAVPVALVQATPTVATVAVSGATVTGSATTLPGSTSNVTLADGALWNMTGNSTLTNLSSTASQILFSTPNNGNFKTLTVANYVGGSGSVIGLNTVLASDGAASDRLVLNGGTASGQSALRIKNAGGPGALTLSNGIVVVDTVNGGSTAPTAFILDGRAVAGPYEYRLFRSSVDDSNPQAWYLRSEQSAPGPAPPSPQPLYRPEVGAYLSNQRVAAGMLVHSLHDRLGEPQWSEQQTFDDDDPQRRSVWLRFVGKDVGSRSSDGNFDVSSDIFLLQGGADIAKWTLFRGDDRLHVGAMLGYGWASSDASAKGNPATATADTNGVSVGVYGTWFQNDESRLGWYTDLWAQYGWFSNHVTGQDLPSVGYNSRVLALSAEAGYAWYPFLQYDWAIEPQAQLIYEHGYEGGVDEPNGTHVDGAEGSGWISRLGVRLHRTWTDAGGKRFQPYVTLNWWHDEVDNVIAFNQVSLHDLYPQNRYEIKLGIDVERGKGWTGWSNVGWQVGSQSYHAFIGRIGVKKTW